MHSDMDEMSMALLPTWLRVVWVVLLGAVLVAHVGHAWALPGQRRWWHLGHTVMATGMALMYALPHMHEPGWLYRAGLVLFALLAIAVTGVVVALWRREGALNPLWVFSAAEMLVMTYMFLPASAKLSGVGYILAVYMGMQSLAWALGLWDRLSVFGSPAQFRSTRGSVQIVDPDGHERNPTLLPADPYPEQITRPVLGLTAHSSVVVHITLAVMAASMAYMLAVM